MHRLILVGCGKEKQVTRAFTRARDLYIGPLFLDRRAYAETYEQRGVPWAIISAKHGFVPPDQELAPYDETLDGQPFADRIAWAMPVAQALHDVYPDCLVVEIHAGKAYYEPLWPILVARGYHVEVPCVGMAVGYTRAWLRQNLPKEGQ